MTKTMVTLLVLAAVIISLDNVSGDNNIIKIRFVEFHGLKNLSKYDIIRDTRTKTAGDDIIIDLNSLKGALNSIGLIESYDLRVSDGALSIVIEEKEPRALIGLVSASKTKLFEIDASHKIISLDRVYNTDAPIIFIKEADMPDNVLSSDIRQLIRTLVELKKSHGKIYGQLSEIYADRTMLRVYLRGRKTEVLLKARKEDFIRLGDLTGCLDRSTVRPSAARIINDRAVVVR